MLESREENRVALIVGVAILGLFLGCSATSNTAQKTGTHHLANAAEPECKLQTNGDNVCGYHCKMGSNGRVYCADTPDGKCSLNSDGTYTCTQLAHTRTANGNVASDVETECKMQTDGQKVCGYNCKMGSNGRVYCSSIPNGKCSLNSDGTFACP